MLKVNERTLADNTSRLAQWAKRAIGLSGIQVKVRLREHKLHILCEGQSCPDRKIALERLLLGFKATKMDTLLPADRGQIHQVFLYGRVLGEKRPDWTEQIDPELLLPKPTGTSLSQSEKALAASPGSGLVKSSSQQSLSSSADLYLQEQARAGDTLAIARVLGSSLKSLGVKVKVVARPLPKKEESAFEGAFEDGSPMESPTQIGASSNGINSAKERRLWVFCESAYSPDPSLLATPVTQQLRSLRLEGFRDGVILSQVTGEATPEWMLRVDLTPPEEMLSQWASWGDGEAIARLLSGALAEAGIAVTAVLKESTVHISCHHTNQLPITPPNKQQCIEAIARVLASLAPRSIFAATIYGHEAFDAPPVWVDWLDLPAAKNPALAMSALALAQQGDEGAIAFLLGQLLNPDLDTRLETGGIRIQVRFKDDLLHVMTDAPVCPNQQRVAIPTANFIRNLEIKDLLGVKIYGRRAGQKQPLWNYSVDFVSRNFAAPVGAVEFPKSDAYADNLLTQEGEEKEDRWQTVKVGWQRRSEQIANSLVGSQLFVGSEEGQNFNSIPSQIGYQGAKVAVVWGTVGLMLTAGVDLVIGQILRSPVNRSSSSSPVRTNTPQTTNDALGGIELAPKALPSRRESRRNKDVFDTTGFTQPGNVSVSLDETGQNVKITTNKSSYPSFNNPQLDEKLAFYQQHVAKNGPPDVLIVGSSRALRGIEPQALEQALAAQGYGKIEVFNFGVNGATAQVVDLTIRQILTPEQLPKLIIWADGARAFNSGRSDGTYRAIAESAGYRLLASGSLPRPGAVEDASDKSDRRFGATSKASGNILAINTKQIDSWLNQSLATLSATYEMRDRLQTLLQDRIAATLNDKSASQKADFDGENRVMGEWDGFYPVSIRFDPQTYYEQHAKVTGEYDKDYQSFQLGGDQAIALESLVQFTQAREIPLVFINLPLTEEYLDTARRKYEQEFTLNMLRLSLSREFTFRDWSTLWPSKNEYFSDPSHLNRYGAAAVAQRLAQDPLIPWPKQKQ
ncbi:MAG TPA: DUF1574 domain-containing protein [Cyanobacteria bacterium UBA11369]|nr:DUF1574 domain-containing protein [Cyanobacteria bacterium UBA11371]HBE33256.1 DUF1574 domain-containing protein [Cyanobacteria bacterium UBA11368]HBE49072.1 DUF1574 domain-containing protein [Cyanobacteria bacterium UBA11369]